MQHFATVERPKLLFTDSADPYRPTHLLNGACPYWDGNASDPCDVCGYCGACKVAATNPGNPYNHGHDVDWTYTLVRPLCVEGR